MILKQQQQKKVDVTFSSMKAIIFLRKSFQKSVEFTQKFSLCHSDGNTHPQVGDSISNTRTTLISSSFQVGINQWEVKPCLLKQKVIGMDWTRRENSRILSWSLIHSVPLAQEFQTVRKAITFMLFSFQISHSKGIFGLFPNKKLEIKDNLSCYCLSVKDIIFGIQIPRTILTVQITAGPVQRMKIDFSFPRGVSTHGSIELKGLKKKVPSTSSWYNSYYLKEIFWNTSRLHAVMHGGLQTWL